MPASLRPQIVWSWSLGRGRISVSGMLGGRLGCQRPRPERPVEPSPGLRASARCPGGCARSDESALKGREKGAEMRAPTSLRMLSFGGRLSRPFRALVVGRRFSQGIAALSPGLGSGGPLGRRGRRSPCTVGSLAAWLQETELRPGAAALVAHGLAETRLCAAHQPQQAGKLHGASAAPARQSLEPAAAVLRIRRAPGAVGECVVRQFRRAVPVVRARR